MENEKKSGLGMVGSVVGQVVLGVVCAVGGWIVRDMTPQKPPQMPAKVLAMAKAASMPQAVAVTNAEMRAYNMPERFIAHAEPVQEVDLLPQVDGYVKEICFKEGDLIQEGQVLYVLDDERYQAVANQRRADLSAAEAEERRTKRMLDRMLKADARGVTELERDNAEAGWEKAKASVLQAKANLVVAEYDLKKAKVIAPISGQIGKTSAHVGDYVAPSKGPLARIVQVDPIRVTFPVTDRNYISWRQQRNGSADDQGLRMRLILPNETEYDQQGAFDFDDNQMSRETATITMRLKFPNPDRILIPNSYVTMLSDFREPPKYPSVPQQAIFDLPGGDIGVYVLKADGTAEARVVTTKPPYEGWSPITSGVEAGEKVIISGVHKVKPGAKVLETTATPNEDIQ